MYMFSMTVPKGNLKRHMLVHNSSTTAEKTPPVKETPPVKGDSEVGFLTCRSCGEDGFKNKHSLRKHKEKKHYNISTEASAVAENTATPPKSSQYECQTCGKLFVRKFYLDQHTLTHTKQRDHKCQQCGRGFTQKAHLTLHAKTAHSDERSFACRACPLTFKRKDHCQRHERKTHATLFSFS